MLLYIYKSSVLKKQSLECSDWRDSNPSVYQNKSNEEVTSQKMKKNLY